MEHLFTCRICGKTDEDVEMFVGGIVGFAHGECINNLDKIIDIFTEYCVTAQSGIIFLAEELIKAEKRTHSSTPLPSSDDTAGVVA